MFGLFKKRNQTPRPPYKFFVSEVDKYRYLARKMQSEKDSRFMLIYHFENTGEEAARLLEAAQIQFGTGGADDRVLLLDYDSLMTQSTGPGTVVIVIEIYPTTEKDAAIMSMVSEKSLEAEFYEALDSAFFASFGGERLLKLLENLGVDPGEVIEHSFMTSSVQKAQDKIAEKLGSSEKPIKESLEAWLKANNIQF